MRIRAIIRPLIAIGALAVLCLALRSLDLGEAWRALLSSDPWLLVLALAVQLLSIGAHLIRWHFQLRPPRPIRPWRLASPLLVSYGVGSVASTIVGYVPRAIVAHKRLGLDPGYVAGTLAQEYLIDATVVLLLASLLPLVVPLPEAFAIPTGIFAAALIPLFAIHLALLRRKSMLLPLIRKTPLWPRLKIGFEHLFGTSSDSFLEGLTAAYGSPSRLAPVLLTTCCVWLLKATMFLLLAQAVSLDFDLAKAGSVMAYTSVTLGVPTTPGSVGTLEATSAIVSVSLGASASLAFAFTVLIRVYTTGVSATLGTAFAVWESLRG